MTYNVFGGTLNPAQSNSIRQSETLFQMNLETLTASIALHAFWKQFSLAATSGTSAFEVFLRDALYKSTFYLLTYFYYGSLRHDSITVRQDGEGGKVIVVSGLGVRRSVMNLTTNGQ